MHYPLCYLLIYIPSLTLSVFIFMFMHCVLAQGPNSFMTIFTRIPVKFLNAFLFPLACELRQIPVSRMFEGMPKGMFGCCQTWGFTRFYCRYLNEAFKIYESWTEMLAEKFSSQRLHKAFHLNWNSNWIQGFIKIIPTMHTRYVVSKFNTGLNSDKQLVCFFFHPPPPLVIV